MMPDWLPPPELAQSPPRSLRIGQGAKIAAGVIGGAYAIVASMVVLILFLLSLQMARLQRDGVNALGIVERLYTVHDRGVGYVVEYVFVAGSDNGKVAVERHGKTNLSKSEYGSYRVGSRVLVRYIPARPDISSLQTVMNDEWSHPKLRFYYVVVAVVVGFGLVVLIFLASSATTFFRESRLLKHGIPVPGEVMSEQLIRYSRGSAIRVTYRYRNEGGHAFYGTRIGVSAGTQRQKPTVLHDRDDPTLSLLYPPTLLRAVYKKSG